MSVSPAHSNAESVPPELTGVALRLKFTPSYIAVGVYRLFSDKNLYQPVWAKCKHGARRGAILGAVWAILTFGIQRKFIQIFLTNSPKIMGLLNDTFFGFKAPFNVHTYAAVALVGSQVTQIMRFFLARNIAIAKDRAWAQTVQSRGKGPEFWIPYVEEWDHPPQIAVRRTFVDCILEYSIGRFIVKQVLFLPFHLYPLIGLLISAWLKSLGTARQLHRRYFEAKKMTPYQVAVFMEERKWDYRVFGFTASLLEGLPIIGLIFTVSNRIGGAMWAHDLEKRQHYFAARCQRTGR